MSINIFTMLNAAEEYENYKRLITDENYIREDIRQSIDRRDEAD